MELTLGQPIARIKLTCRCRDHSHAHAPSSCIRFIVPRPATPNTPDFGPRAPRAAFPAAASSRTPIRPRPSTSSSSGTLRCRPHLRPRVIRHVTIMPAVIQSFASGGVLDIFDGVDTRAARGICPPDFWPAARRKLDQLHHVADVLDLRIPPGNRLERLRGTRAGQWSIRINRQYRVCFRWEDGDAYDVEIVDYH